MKCKRENWHLSGLNAPPVDERSLLNDGAEQIRTAGIGVLRALDHRG